MSNPKEPRTEAGRALLAYELMSSDDAEQRYFDHFGRHPEWRDVILAIEAEARAPEDADLAAAVEALPGYDLHDDVLGVDVHDPTFVSRAAVLALLQPAAVTSPEARSDG